MAFTALIISSILTQFIFCFPPILFLQLPLNITNTTSQFLPPEVAPYQGSQLLFLPYVSSDNLTYTLFNYNMTPGVAEDLNTVSFTFGSPLIDCSLSTARENLILFFQTVLGCEGKSLNLYSLQVQKTFSCGQLLFGTYLWNYDISAYHSNDERIYYDIQGHSQQLLANYSHSSSLRRRKVNQFANRDESHLFTFNNDSSVFLIRNMSSADQMINNFTSPLEASINVTGNICAYVGKLDVISVYRNDGFLIRFFDGYPHRQQHYSGTANVTHCYYQGTNSGTDYAIFAQQATNGLKLLRMQLLATSTFQRSLKYYAGYHYISNTNHPCYMFITNGTNLQIYSKSTFDQIYYDNWVANLSAFNYTPPATNTTTNTTNTTTPTNTTNTSSTSNNTTPSVNQTSTNTSSNSSIFIQLVQELLSNAAMTALNKVPGGRKIIPFLCFLVNLDELWLYQYHERDYGATLTRFFDKLSSMENQKWQIIGETHIDQVYHILGVEREEVYRFIDTKAQYSSPQFRAREGKGETFLPACWEFLTFNLIFVLIGFFLMRWGFHLLFNYRISIFLRAFSSLVFLAPLLFDGNLQYFFFLLFSQVSLGFSLTPKDKFFNILSYLLYFVIIWGCIVSSFMAYYLNKKLAKYIIDNWRSRVEGLLAYSITNAIRLMIFGAIHSLMRRSSMQLPFLMLFETIFVIFLLYSIKKIFHKINFKIWFSIVFSFLRISLQAILWIQQKYSLVNNNDTETQMLLQTIIAFLLMVYVLVFYTATLWELIYEIIQLLTPDKTKGSQDKQNKNEYHEKTEKQLKRVSNEFFIVQTSKTQRHMIEKNKQEFRVQAGEIKKDDKTRQKLKMKGKKVKELYNAKTVQFVTPLYLD